MICTKCGNKIESHHKFCINCGTKVNLELITSYQKVEFCAYCNKKIKPHYKFCIYCGAEVDIKNREIFKRDTIIQKVEIVDTEIIDMNENNNYNDNEKGMVAKAIESMSLLDDKKEQEKLKRDAIKHTLKSWRELQSNKVAAVGFGTGLLGGPIGLVLEGADMGYLLSIAGRACYGVGHILGKKIDYEKDIEGILAIWAGVGKGCSKDEVNSQVAVQGGVVPIGGKIAFKTLTKVSPKMASKIASKVGIKIMGKAGAKMSAKVATKLGTKWIPIAGGVVSAGINKWVVEGMLDAAEEYYKSEYILVDEKKLN